MIKTIDERFWEKVDKRGPDDCWNWIANKEKGYGRIRIRGRLVLAHRVSYAIHYGWPPNCVDVLHVCDNPSCVNPKHLKIGTHADNMRDMAEKGRRNGPFGDRHPRAKMTPDRVKEMRELFRLGDTSISEIGRRFGVHVSTAWDIVNRKTWLHVP